MYNENNKIVLRIKNNKFLSIVQNAKGFNDNGIYGNYGDTIELAILDEDKNYVEDGTFDYGIKSYVTSLELKDILNKLCQ